MCDVLIRLCMSDMMYVRMRNVVVCVSGCAFCECLSDMCILWV